MENLEQVPSLPEDSRDEMPTPVLIDTEQVALRGAGKLSEVLGKERLRQFIAETQSNARSNYRWALRNIGGVPRA